MTATASNISRTIQGKAIIIATGIMAALLLNACAAQGPILYPNTHYNQVGASAADRDIKDCVYLANQAGANSGSGGQAAASAAESAAVGGAAGAGYGAVRGDVGTSAAAGAAAAGAGSLMHSAIHSGKQSPAFRNYVDRCLRDRGYDPIGWR